MSDNPFYRLAPFIQDFIYREGWDELRGIQVQATRAILDTPGHVLITSGTASGKTEAAFLPVLTALQANPSTSIGVLYIGPLKALINDQFERLNALLEQTDIPVQGWHGDIAQSKKLTFLKRAQGVLQITPESLEAMLIRRNNELSRLFGDLRFVIIDEVHAFIDSDRGRQIQCQLQRLARHQRTPPRRIGLSATIGDPQLAMDWLASGTALAVTLIEDTGGSREIQLGLERFPELPRDFDRRLKQAQAVGDTDRLTELQTLEQDSLALYEHMYRLTLQQKTLVFANARMQVETVVSNLRRLAKRNHTPDIYHVHHGSISAPLREAAETAMKDSDHAACTSATVTLELGIDLGQLDQVLQIDATHSVSSFVQRLGRSGRKHKPAKMFFYCQDAGHEDTAALGQRIPWNLLQTLAIIQLYLEDRWIEPPELPKLPVSLLYHQTMSSLLAATELQPAQLAERILPLPPFQHVTQDQFRELLRYLLSIDHLEITEIGSLIVGLAAEKIVNNYRFYATFEAEEAYQVREGSRELGTISEVPPPGEHFSLAGHAWEVIEVNTETRVVLVKHVAGRADTHWSGGKGDLHGRVVERIRRILREDAVYGYMQPGAVQRLQEARDLARQSELTTQPILPMGGNRFMCLPWQGSKVFRTIVNLLAYQGVSIKYAQEPYYFEIEVPDCKALAEVKQVILPLLSTLPTAKELADTYPTATLIQAKYDHFVPESLLREAIAEDHLDITSAKGTLSGMFE